MTGDTPPQLTADLFARTRSHHAEGPFWDELSQRLLSVDCLAGAIVSVDAAGGITRYPVPSPVVTVIRRRSLGGFAVATQHGISITDDAFTEFREVARVAGDPAVRTNDGGCDALGGFVIGTMACDERPGAGSVYRVGQDHGVTTLLSGVSISNGTQWSVDGSLAYYIDSPTKRVDVFHVDQVTGEWSDPKPHITIEQPAAVPDGMAIDVEGGLWVALWGAGAVNHYDSAGRLVETVTVPGVTQVSSCTFGGSHRDVLFITTSRQNLMPGEEPLAGSVFAVQTDSVGATLRAFSG